MTDSSERDEDYRFGEFTLDVPARELRRQGARIHLQDQPFQVLLMLVRRAGKVVSRDELRQRLWPSSVFVDFDHGLNNAIAKLREVLGDQAAAPQFIETVPRVGYRFIGRAAQESPGSEVASRSASPTYRWLMAAALVAGISLALLIAIRNERDRDDAQRATSPSPVPSIAVLPFASLSPEPENEYFADGLTEELVVRLAGIRSIRVVARTSTFRFKGSKEPTGAIASALQVDYLLEGSVRRSEERLRITAQLIDARDDGHVWSQTFDRGADDIFRVQEEIAISVANALKVSLLDADEHRIRRHGTEDPEAYRLFLIAHAHLLGRTKGSDPAIAKRLLDQVIERDPGFAAAHADLARFYLRRVSSTLADAEENERLGTAAAEQAVALDPSLSESRQARGNFQFWRYRARGDYEAHIAGENNLQRAIELDPANSLAYEDFGRALMWHEPDLAMSMLERAIQVDLLCTFPNVLIASVLGNRGQLDAARTRCDELLARNPDAKICAMAIGTLETYYGNFDEAVPLLQDSARGVGGAARIQLWSIHMSMNDVPGATQWLDFGKEPFEKDLSDAARHAMQGRFDRAFAVLQRHREANAASRLVDAPAAKFALLAGKPREARIILERRFPDLARGIEPISARNVLPAIDLAAARMRTGAKPEADALLRRVADYLEGPKALQLPMFLFQRARVHALAGENDAAFSALDLAFERGFRTTWALDLRPQSFLYVDPISADPALDGLRGDPRLTVWFERVNSENAMLRARIGAAQSAKAG